MAISKPSGNTVKITYKDLCQSLLRLDIFTGKSFKLTLYLNFHLNFLEFDTNFIEFGEILGLELHKEVYYSLDKFQKIGDVLSSFCFENAESAPIARSNIGRTQFQIVIFLQKNFVFVCYKHQIYIF